MSKRAIVAFVVPIITAFATKMGWITGEQAAAIIVLAGTWIGADTLRPSGTAGIAGSSGPIPKP